MKLTSCVWCSEPCKVQDDYDGPQHKAVCSQSCKDAETLFNLWMSDEEINRRAHYRYLTTGEDSG